jgi:dolichyl-diphosphooligosaccharide--protein glycosyltransferase
VVLVAGLFTVFLYLTFTGASKWSGRSMTLLDPTYASKFIPIVASVSEHQATTWSSFFFDLHVLIVFFPIGLYFCFKDYTKGKLYIALYGVLAVYFASKRSFFVFI